ncbi:hypothetical protein LF817_16955 [Halobacillus sp. A1]|uniref:hypothetical protein n=1 Tax=Halobacillus sp. A1 TaxID=2880262 RepID=UPI0020A6CAED|nr:hypothetical protein [Halobacillus sp. A1]MCP3033018.1 hypothetical protein [Halobacillus sp. A1]
MKDPKKLIYATFHLGTPLFYFFGYTAIQFFRGNSVAASIPDTLAIIAIYSFIMNIMWLFYVDKLDKAINNDRKNQTLNERENT